MSTENDDSIIEPPGVAPEVISYSDVDSQMGEFARNVELNERILQRLQQYELMLLDAANLPALLDVLLLETSKHFSIESVNLRLYDHDGQLAELMPSDLRYPNLELERDSFDMQQLYGATPRVEILQASDSRTASIGGISEGAGSVVLLPLIREGLLVGSFHWSATSSEPFTSEVEVDFINHLAAIIAICLENCANAERLSLLSLLDPLTRLSNQRALDLELRKEISRSQRNQKPLTVLLIEVDGLKDIADNYGHLAADFTLKAIAGHIPEMLRSTDHLARCAPARFALLLPACSEAKGQEIAERIRSETEFIEIDDARGANLFASLSIGLVSWSSQNYPAINMEQLAGQVQTTVQQGLRRASSSGGNRVTVARLTTMLV